MTSFSVAAAVEKQQRFFVDNLMLADVSIDALVILRALRMTRASSLNVGKLYTDRASIKLSTKNLRCFSKEITDLHFVYL